MNKHATALLMLALLPGLQLYAIPPDQPPEIEVFIAGSTAQDAALESLMRLTSGVPGTPNICQKGSLDVYRGEINGIRKRVYFCLTSEFIDGVPSGLRLAVHKSSAGFGEGVAPVANGKPIAYIDLENLPDNEGCSKPARVLHTGNLAAYSNRSNCGGAGKLAVPGLGVSDIEPALLGEDTTGLSFRSKSQIIWGLPVSKNFRNALQALQGLVPADVAHDSPQRESEENMPSLTSAQVASIFSGAIESWNQMYDQNGNPSYLSPDLPVHPPQLRDLSGTQPGAYQPSPGGGQTVYVCRRTSSSGTQAAFETHYLKRRCLQDALHFVPADDGSNVLFGGDPEVQVRRVDPAGRVFAGGDTSAVRACLDAHDEFNRWAIGMFSTEHVGDNLRNEFRFIRVDGFAPTLLNAHRGLWSHVSEPTLQWRSDGRAQLASSPEGRTLLFLRRNIGKPRVLGALNAGAEHAWGQGGYLAIPDPNSKTNVVPVTPESLLDYPVAGVSRTTQDCQVSLVRGSSSAAQ
ncbi:MAG: hypothetical protein QNJ05_03210 [Woeseiaceae bacterium]|nr:hypothetical protein [Woeseiaceae bacterium]